MITRVLFIAMAVICAGCLDIGLHELDKDRYQPERGRASAYNACLTTTQGREQFDVCMAQRGYTRKDK